MGISPTPAIKCYMSAEFFRFGPGANRICLMSLMGYKDLKTTMRYIRAFCLSNSKRARPEITFVSWTIFYSPRPEAIASLHLRSDAV